MRLKYGFISSFLIVCILFVHAEEITSIQKNVKCEQSYEFATPGSLGGGQSTTVNVDIPGSYWYLHRFNFTPDFTGKMTVGFSGGSDTTSWLLGEDGCSSSSLFKATDTSNYVQDIQVTAGVELYGTIYDWYQSSDLVLKFSRSNDDTDTIVYEDAEDGNINGWRIFDQTPSGATIENIYNNEKMSRVIKTSGDGQNNGYILKGSWGNSNQKYLKWNMKSNDKFIIYVYVSTSQGSRVFYYSAHDGGSGIHGRNYIRHGLGSGTSNGTWQTHVRDLAADLRRYEPNNDLLKVNDIAIRGDVLIDDIQLTDSDIGAKLPVEVSAPGIVLTFDDSVIDDWYAMRDTFNNNEVHVTFFCNGWKNLSGNEVAKFSLLEQDGHEIAYHTTEHKNIYDSSYDNASDKANAYLQDQILPGISHMQGDGFSPVSFSYPNTLYTPRHNSLISQYLPHIRIFFQNTIGIDNLHNKSIEDINSELLKIKNEKDIMVMIGHRILPESNPDTNPYRISIEKLMQIINEAKRLGLRFYTLEEAHKIYLGQ